MEAPLTMEADGDADGAGMAKGVDVDADGAELNTGLDGRASWAGFPTAAHPDREYSIYAAGHLDRDSDLWKGRNGGALSTDGTGRLRLRWASWWLWTESRSRWGCR